MQNTYFLCGGPIELCSIVVIYLGDFDIGLCHPLIVQCIHVCTYNEGVYDDDEQSTFCAVQSCT